MAASRGKDDDAAKAQGAAPEDVPEADVAPTAGQPPEEAIYSKPRPCLCKGELKYDRKAKGNKTRMFLLYPDALEYYTDEASWKKGSEPRGWVLVRDIVEFQAHDLAFRMTVEGVGLLSLVASSLEDYKRWCRVWKDLLSVHLGSAFTCDLSALQSSSVSAALALRNKSWDGDGKALDDQSTDGPPSADRATSLDSRSERVGVGHGHDIDLDFGVVFQGGASTARKGGVLKRVHVVLFRDRFEYHDNAADYLEGGPPLFRMALTEISFAELDDKGFSMQILGNIRLSFHVQGEELAAWRRAWAKVDGAVEVRTAVTRRISAPGGKVATKEPAKAAPARAETPQRFRPPPRRRPSRAVAPAVESEATPSASSSPRRASRRSPSANASGRSRSASLAAGQPQPTTPRSRASTSRSLRSAGRGCDASKGSRTAPSPKRGSGEAALSKQASRPAPPTNAEEDGEARALKAGRRGHTGARLVDQRAGNCPAKQQPDAAQEATPKSYACAPGALHGGQLFLHHRGKLEKRSVDLFFHGLRINVAQAGSARCSTSEISEADIQVVYVTDFGFTVVTARSRAAFVVKDGQLDEWASALRKMLQRCRSPREEVISKEERWANVLVQGALNMVRKTRVKKMHCVLLESCFLVFESANDFNKGQKPVLETLLMDAQQFQSTASGFILRLGDEKISFNCQVPKEQEAWSQAWQRALRSDAQPREAPPHPGSKDGTSASADIRDIVHEGDVLMHCQEGFTQARRLVLTDKFLHVLASAGVVPSAAHTHFKSHLRNLRGVQRLTDGFAISLQGSRAPYGGSRELFFETQSASEGEAWVGHLEAACCSTSGGPAPATAPRGGVAKAAPAAENSDSALVRKFQSTAGDDLVYTGPLAVATPGSTNPSVRHFALFRDRLDSWDRLVDMASSRAPVSSIPIGEVRSVLTVSSGLVLHLRGRKVGLHAATKAELQSWCEALSIVIGTACSWQPSAVSGTPRSRTQSLSDDRGVDGGLRRSRSLGCPARFRGPSQELPTIVESPASAVFGSPPQPSSPSRSLPQSLPGSPPGSPAGPNVPDEGEQASQ